MGGGSGDGDGDGDWAVLPCTSLTDVALNLIGKFGSGKSATANCILGDEAFVSQYSSNSSVTEICQKSSTTFYDGCAARTVNVIDTPGLFDMGITIEDARKEIVRCMEMSKDGIHAMLMVFSATSRFSREDNDTIESIKLFFGDKILDHMILVFTHGDLVGEEITWKKMLTDTCPGYLQDLSKLFVNRVVFFDNKTSNTEQREAQLKKLLDVVDFVISINCGKAFSFQMLPHAQEARDRQNEIGLDGYSAEQTYEQLAQITKLVDENLNSTEEEIRSLRESLEKAQQEHANVREEMRNSENWRWLDKEKRGKQKEEIRTLKQEQEKKRKERRWISEEIRTLSESLEKAKEEKENYKRMYDNWCIIM